jgi:hypothetical protein
MTRNRAGLLCLLASAALAASSPGSHAQDAAPPGPTAQCWKIVGHANAAPYGLILLDQCTGKTWLLTKVFTREKSPADPNEKPKRDTFTYKWLEIKRDDGRELKFETDPP